MKKLAFGDNKVFVALSKGEFSRLAGTGHQNVPDGTKVSLAQIKAKLDLVDANEPELTDLKNLATSVANKINDIGL